MSCFVTTFDIRANIVTVLGGGGCSGFISKLPIIFSYNPDSYIHFRFRDQSTPPLLERHAQIHVRKPRSYSFFGDIETPHGMYICIFNIYSDFSSFYWVILTYFFHITLQYNQHHIQLNISHQRENSGLSHGSVHMYCCNSHHMNLCRNLQFEKKR